MQDCSFLPSLENLGEGRGESSKDMLKKTQFDKRLPVRWVQFPLQKAQANFTTGLPQSQNTLSPKSISGSNISIASFMDPVVVGPSQASLAVRITPEIRNGAEGCEPDSV